MQSSKSGLAELKEARASSRGLFWCAGLFSLFANLLMLTGPIYMLQVYDRVLGSGSEETLVALTGLVVFLYGVMGFLDFVRGRILARIGVRFQMALDRRVYCAAMRAASSPTTARDVDGLRNIDMIQRFYASPAMVALFDLPWTPIFLICIFAFHPWLGWLAVAGGGTLIALTLAN
ncbi:MAG: type I secretion system permease/ATPase, partial [Pseudomonadota bacterium]